MVAEFTWRQATGTPEGVGILMKIGVDARHLSGRLTGIGRYILEILRRMPEHLPDAQWVLYSRHPIKGLDLGLVGHGRIVEEGSWGFRQLPSALWVKTRLGHLMAGDDLDVVWAASTLLPRLDCPIVSTVYDLNHLIVPDTMALITRLAYRLWFAADVLRADEVVSISNGTALRLLESVGRQASAVAQPGASWAGSARLDIQAPTRAPQPYVLSVATREPRKNLNNLIEAMAILKQRGELPTYSLALAGAPGWGPELQALRRGRPDWLVELGYVPEHEMAALIASAEVLAQPSVYEGFGMPAAEAAALGTRVVATDIPELREAAGSAGIFCGTDAASIADGLVRSLALPKPAPRSSASWNDAAAVVAAALTRAASGRSR